MKKPQIKINSDKVTKVWGYSFKECVDYIKLTYQISPKVYMDLLDWGNPVALDYPFFFVEKVTDQIQNPYENIANQILNDLYCTNNIDYKQNLIDSIEMLFIQFSVNHTIENVPIIAFLSF